MNEDHPVLAGEDAAPPPPPSPSSGAAATGAAPARERFDLGSLFTFAFRDPKALSKFLIGCIMVLLIPLLGFGLLPLMGFGVRTARGALRGDEHPMPDWDDFGGLLLDGLKAAGVIVGYSLVAGMVGLLLVAIGIFWVAIGEEIGSAAIVVTSILGSVAAVIFLVLCALLVKALIPAGLLQLAATGRFTAAFRLNENLAAIRGSLGTYVVLLLTLILFAIISDATVLLCIVGAIPGMFWWFAVAGASIGHAGRLMGAREESGAA